MNRREAMRRKDAGAIALANGPNRGMMQRILGAILRRKAGELFTSEDIRKKLKPGPDWNPNCWGSAFHTASRAGHIVAQSFQRGKRPESHARILVVWRRA
jgi:hypothetical protein